MLGTFIQLLMVYSNYSLTMQVAEVKLGNLHT